MIIPSDIWHEIFKQQRIQRFNYAKKKLSLTYFNIVEITYLLMAIGFDENKITDVHVRYGTRSNDVSGEKRLILVITRTLDS